MELNEMEQILKGTDIESKIEILSHLSDVFESYNKNIANFEELIAMLLKHAMHERDLGVKEEIFDALLDAATYQNTEKINWDLIEKQMNELPTECLTNAISILGLSHNKKYLPTLTKFTNHENKAIRAAAIVAMNEFE